MACLRTATTCPNATVAERVALQATERVSHPVFRGGSPGRRAARQAAAVIQGQPDARRTVGERGDRSSFEKLRSPTSPRSAGQGRHDVRALARAEELTRVARLRDLSGPLE